jgi:aminoglycoside 6'-N-acetyltransferase I
VESPAAVNEDYMSHDRKMNVLIKRAGTQDHGVWVILRRQLWSGSKKMHAAEVRDFSSKRNFICFIAWDEDKKAVGFTEASIRPFANGCKERPVPFLEGLWVDPRFRGRNIGKQLVSAVESWAIRRSFREIGSDALISNKVSHKAHAAYGFEETERVVYFRKCLIQSNVQRVAVFGKVFSTRPKARRGRTR